MKHHVGLTIDAELFNEIERAREREKRSTFCNYLLRLGLKTHKQQEKIKDQKLAMHIP